MIFDFPYRRMREAPFLRVRSVRLPIFLRISIYILEEISKQDKSQTEGKAFSLLSLIL